MTTFCWIQKLNRSFQRINYTKHVIQREKKKKLFFSFTFNKFFLIFLSSTIVSNSVPFNSVSDLSCFHHSGLWPLNWRVPHSLCFFTHRETKLAHGLWGGSETVSDGSSRRGRARQSRVNLNWRASQKTWTQSRLHRQAVRSHSTF